MNLIFAGTPEFAVPSLKACLASSHRVCAVLTQPDRPAGRGRRLLASPVKALAESFGIPVLQPETLRSPDQHARLHALGADLMVVVAYGLILPQAVLEIPRLGCVNVHASLLPRWRGAAPIQRALLAGDDSTGVTIMRVEAKLDAGPMFRRVSCSINSDETAGELQQRLAELGAEALRLTLDELAAGPVEPERQDESQVTYAEKLTKQEAELDWNRPAVVLERQVRAFNPWPVAETRFADAPLRIWRAQALHEDATGLLPGTVLPGRTGCDVATGAGVLRLIEVQLPSRRAIRGEEFIRAHRPPLRFGD